MKDILKLAILIVAIVPANKLYSQESEGGEKSVMVRSKAETFGDLSLAAGAGYFSASLGASRTHGLLKNKALRLGYGLRFSGFYGSDLDYTTAPAKLTTTDKVDTLNVGEPITLGLSAVIHLGYQITPKFHVGFNIDAAGLGFGATGKASHMARDKAAGYPRTVVATPTSYNLLLMGDNDIGQLKSEFTLAYAINEKMRIRGGYDFTFSEYTTAVKLADGNDRFRYKASMFFVGFSYNLETKYD